MQFKSFVLMFLLVFLGIRPNEESISWKADRKLSWSDFKAESDSNSPAVALTASGITFGYSIDTADRRIIDFSTSVEAHFYPNKSWYNKNKADNHILRHEQLHFDITELYARQFRQELSNLKVSKNIKITLERLHQNINMALNQAQKRYDQESKHSINKEIQKQWEDFIALELLKLNNYKSN